jgi:hypothetical protein
MENRLEAILVEVQKLSKESRRLREQNNQGPQDHGRTSPLPRGAAADALAVLQCRYPLLQTLSCLLVMPITAVSRRPP